MTAVARNRLAGVLGAAAAPAASSVRMRAKPDDLHLTVKGVGRVRLPVPPKQASQLCRLGRKARFGRGEETLTDPEVRDTWEIPKSLVRIEWSDTFAAILESVRDELGLAAHCELAADFHSMLVYEPGQFFVPHQDSEKDDTMVGTLVVTLPSTYTGGALVIDDGGEAVTYRGSKVALTLVAFYADCRHEVRPVTSGYRITLTYNLLLRGDASKPLTGEDDATVSEVASCLDQYFTTRAARLVYLLDHEYTARGLSWSRLKGADAHRSALLRAAADRSACETVLALADIQETWSAYESEPEYGYRGRDRYWDDFEDDDHEGGRSGEYELEELIESSVRLLHWTRQAGTGVEDISLTVDDAEVCATTPSTDVQPYASQYEGYMGNYGNTMDRWYRRAALVVWPHDQAFRNRAEAAPAWALDELGAWVRANDLAGARAAATTLEPIWDTAARTGQSAGFLGKGLRTARALDDAELAEMLLRPFRVESLSPIHAPPLARLAARHGGHWMDQLLRTWFGDRGPWPYAGGQDRSAWLASLPRLCKALHAKGDPGTDTAHRLLDLSWGWLGQSVRQGIATQPPSYRDQRLSELGRPLAAVLTAAGQTGAVKLRDGVIEFGRQQRDEVIVCVMPAFADRPYAPG